MSSFAIIGLKLNLRIREGPPGPSGLLALILCTQIMASGPPEESLGAPALWGTQLLKYPKRNLKEAEKINNYS